MSGTKQRQLTSRTADAPREIERGRNAFERHAWAEAFRSLVSADQVVQLGAENLERLGVSAYLIGREEDYLKAIERAHHSYLHRGEERRAVRCAFWLGLHFVSRGEKGPATGWLARARRLLDGVEYDCVERGYLLLPVVQQHIDAANLEAAHAAAVEAAEIGAPFQDADLAAGARHFQGRVLILQGQVEKGLALLDEAMIAVTTGELSPLATGLIYCSVIAGCQQVYAFGRAREWTTALAEWCDRQPDLVAFTGRCLVHRAEIMQVSGAWRDAINEARRVNERFSNGPDQDAAAAACYQQAEVQRLRGEFQAAEEMYRRAGRLGWEPQPGLSLLRLAQGRIESAATAIRRVVDTTSDRLQRTRLLPAYIEIMLAAGDIAAAAGAARELEEIAESFDADVLGAIAAHASGSVALAEGDAQVALGLLRRAFEAWQHVEAPYLAARVRVELGLACRVLGDEEAAGMELEAARALFERLGAAPDVARIDALVRDTSAPRRPCGLTRRELQVLRLISAGKTNRAIAAELFVSPKTVDRHVSNIFDKLDVSSRAAATSYAFRHNLI